MALNVIESQALAHPELAETYATLGQLFSRKLYHQLTEACLTFAADPASSRGDNLVILLRDFVSQFAAKMNQLAYVKLAWLCLQGLPEQEALTVLESDVLGSRGRLGEEAWLVAQTRAGLLMLRLGRSAEVKVMLAECEELLESLGTSEASVHAAVFELACLFYELNGPPDRYYHSATHFMAYANLEELGEAARHRLAVSVSLAALTGDNIYNFGEVLQTPILESLLGTGEEWLRLLMLACNSGDIEQFNALISANAAAVQSQVGLSARLEFVKEKIALMSLVELVFRRPADQRVIPFAEVAAQTLLPVNDVELLAIRAMSLGIIKGAIDQVDQTITVTYVQPRVLAGAQLAVLSEQLQSWGSKVQGQLMTMRDQTAELREA